MKARCSATVSHLCLALRGLHFHGHGLQHEDHSLIDEVPALRPQLHFAGGDVERLLTSGMIRAQRGHQGHGRVSRIPPLLHGAVRARGTSRLRPAGPRLGKSAERGRGSHDGILRLVAVQEFRREPAVDFQGDHTRPLHQLADCSSVRRHAIQLLTALRLVDLVVGWPTVAVLVRRDGLPGPDTLAG